MNCQDINQNIYKYCEGTVSSDLHQKISQHLSECESCRINHSITLIEDQFLKDTDDIPLLSPLFTSRVMSSLESVDYRRNNLRPLVMLKNPWFSFDRATWYSGSAMVVAVIALCLYIPHFSKKPAPDINLARNTIIQQQSQQSSDLNAIEKSDERHSSPNSAAKNIPIDNSQPKISPPNPPTTAQTPIVFDSSQDALSSVPLEVSSRSGVQEMARAQSLTQASPSPVVSAYYFPENIPARFKLVMPEEKANIFNYVSQDGKDYFALTILPNPEKMATMTSLNNFPKNNPPSLTREFEIGDKKITVNYSGNLPADELTHLVDNITFKESSITDN
jgi:hypothetical protein